MRYFVCLAAVVAALCGSGSVALSQVLVPHTLKINFGNLEEQGLALARDAAQLAQFEQYDLALPRARLAVQLAPQAFQTQAILGSLYLRKEEYAKAIASLTAAYNLKKDNPAILFSLGAAHLRNGEYQPAIQRLKQGIELSPKEPTALFDLGNAYFLTRRYDDAIAEYRRVLDLEKKFWAATNNIGLVEYERGNVDVAVKRWEEAVALAQSTEDKPTEPMLALAAALFAKGDRTKGVQLGTDALKIDPRYGNLDFLKENLWGEKLLGEARTLLAVPMLKELVDTSSKTTTRSTPRRRVQPGS